MAYVKLHFKQFLFSTIFWLDIYFSKYSCVHKLQDSQYSCLLQSKLGTVAVYTGQSKSYVAGSSCDSLL